MEPTVSIIIPTYNRLDFLKEFSVPSVLGQIYKDWELIIVDDGSAEDIKGFVKNLQETFSQEKIFYIYQQNMGQGAARNVGLHIARGKWVLFLDSDDILLPEMIQNLLSKSDELDAISSRSWVLNLATDKFEGIGNPNPSSILYRKVFFEKHGLYREERELIGLEDSELSWRILNNKNFRWAADPSPLIIYTKHKNQITQAQVAHNQAEGFIKKIIFLIDLHKLDPNFKKFRRQKYVELAHFEMGVGNKSAAKIFLQEASAIGPSPKINLLKALTVSPIFYKMFFRIYRLFKYLMIKIEFLNYVTKYRTLYRAAKKLHNEMMKNLSKDQLLGLFNKAETKLRAYDRYSGPGIIKKIERAVFFPRIYFIYVAARLGLLPRSEFQGRTFWGRDIKLRLSDITDAQPIYFFGTLPRLENRLIKFFIKHISPQDIFYDVGANWGFYTFLAQALITKGEIHSFEPLPYLYEYLEKNNQKDKVVLNKIALLDKKGAIKFFDNSKSGHSGSSTTREDVAGDLGLNATINVQADTLDEYVIHHTPPTFLKIDVEGGEIGVIGGGINFLKSHSPVVVIEVWSGEKGEKYSKAAVDELRGLNYIPHLINNDGELEAASNDFLSKIKDTENVVFIKT